MTASTTYPEFREAVRLAVVEASGLVDSAVVWSQDGEPAADPLVVLSVISDVRTDDTPVREALAISGDDYVKTLSEMRDVAVQVRVEALREDALGLANEIALKLRRQSVRDLLEPECVLVGDSGMHDYRYRSRDLWIQARAFELFLRIVLEDTDPTAVGTIGTVKVQGDTLDLPPKVTLSEDTIDEDDPS